MLLNVGQQITVRALRANGVWYRKWVTTVEWIDGEGLVTLSRPGSPTVDMARGDLKLERTVRGYYWYDRFYNLCEEYDCDGSPLEIYINIGSPPIFRSDGFDWTDHELDVKKLPGRSAHLLDEDEFAEAALKYGYTPEFQRRCYAAAREALALAETWQYARRSGV